VVVILGSGEFEDADGLGALIVRAQD